jgi:hypothetical protein
MTDLTVTTFYWSDPERRRDYSFNPEHVRILRNMVERNLSVPHRFVCVTNEAFQYPIGEEIETIPLDREWFDKCRKHCPGTVFPRLWMRSPDYPIKGRILNLDIDVVIVNNIDSIVDRDEESVFWRNPNYESGGASRAFYQTSIQLFTQGSHPELWSDFTLEETKDANGNTVPPTPSWANRRFGGHEQAWVSERLPWTLPYWDDKDGIYGAGRLFRGQMDKGITELPENARIVSFPGNRMPDQPEVQKMHPWIAEHYR